MPTSEAPKPTLSPEIRAGFLVTCSIAVLLFLLFKAGSAQVWGNQKKVHLMFNYISGLENHSPVQFGGHKIGKVSAVEFINTNNEAKIKVTLDVNQNVPVRTDSEAFIEILGFMGEKFIEITPGTTEAPLLEEGGTLKGTDPIALMKVVKDGTELLTEFQKIADSLSGMASRNEENMDEIFTNLNATSENLKEMTHDLKLHPWKLLRKGKEQKAETKAVEDEKKKGFLFF